MRVPLLVVALALTAAAPVHAYVVTQAPLCIPFAAGPDQETTMTTTNECFQSGGAQCEAIIVGINPHTTPPEVAAGPDWMCIEELLGQSAIRPFLLPGHTA